MYGDLKLTFQQQILTQYMQEVRDGMAVLIKRYAAIETGDLLNSLAYTALMEGSSSRGSLSFKEYGRMIDMGVGRGNPLGGLKATKVSLQSKKYEGEALIKKQRKRQVVYSRMAYGKLTWLSNKLLYGYTEETIALLKQNIQDGSLPASTANG